MKSGEVHPAVSALMASACCWRRKRDLAPGICMSRFTQLYHFFAEIVTKFWRNTRRCLRRCTPLCAGCRCRPAKTLHFMRDSNALEKHCLAGRCTKLLSIQSLSLTCPAAHNGVRYASTTYDMIWICNPRPLVFKHCSQFNKTRCGMSLGAGREGPALQPRQQRARKLQYGRAWTSSRASSASPSAPRAQRRDPRVAVRVPKIVNDGVTVARESH
jgi:hypothetical protein